MRMFKLIADICSLPYRIGFSLWKSYMLRKKRASLPGFTIVVGNLTIGGSGKTPFVIEITRELVDRGIRVAVLTRGYARKSSKLVVLNPKLSPKPSVRETGDEPMLIFRKLGERVPVVIHKDRIRSAKLASEQFDVQAFVLDDAFQHLKVLPDYSVLLINLSDINGGALLPLGRFREPIDAIRRADLVVVNYRDKPFDNREFRFGVPYTRMRYELKSDEFKGVRAFAFAGIANPKEFKRMLEASGIELVGFKRFRDHKWYSEKDLRKIIADARKAGAEVILTTEKDFVRIESPPPDIRPVPLSVEIEELDNIAAVIARRINPPH